MICVFHLLYSVQPSAVEKVDWFPECTTEIPDSDELRDWMILGRVKTNTSDTFRYTIYRMHASLSVRFLLITCFDCLQRKLKIEDETEFCTEDLLHTLLRCKVSYNCICM